MKSFIALFVVLLAAVAMAQPAAESSKDLKGDETHYWGYPYGAYPYAAYHHAYAAYPYAAYPYAAPALHAPALHAPALFLRR